MVRISGARTSGTAFSMTVVHVSPEAAVGGALAPLQTGDRIRLLVHGKKMELSVDSAELERGQARHAQPSAWPGVVAVMTISMPLKSRRPTRAAISTG